MVIFLMKYNVELIKVKSNKFKVYDLRNLYSAKEMKKNKIKYYSIGRPNIN